MKDEEIALKGIWYIVIDIHRDVLEFLIEGIEYSIKRIIEDYYNSPEGVIDLYSSQEGIYGTALIAMQNYIDLTIADFYNAAYNTGLYKQQETLSLNDFAKKAREKDDICKNGTEFVNLINALANSYKHRNDLEIYCKKIRSFPSPENKNVNINDIKTNVYRGHTQNTLNALDLLEFDNNGEILPATRGIEFLDKDRNLKNIIQHLFNSWRPRMHSMLDGSIK